MKITFPSTPVKDCPFCHAMPTFNKEPLWHGSHGYRDNYEYYVACENEECRIKPSTKHYNDIYDMNEAECFEKAIEDWNIR